MHILAFSRSVVAPLLRDKHVAFSTESLPTAWSFAERAVLETDEAWLQLVPYAVLVSSSGNVWAYRRRGGDARLDGRCSVGVGGHVDATDAVNDDLLATARRALVRELREELVLAPPIVPELPVAWINEQDSAVGRVHLGLVWHIPWQNSAAPQPSKDEKLVSLGFVDPAMVRQDNGYELWSELAVRQL